MTKRMLLGGVMLLAALALTGCGGLMTEFYNDRTTPLGNAYNDTSSPFTFMTKETPASCAKVGKATIHGIGIIIITGSGAGAGIHPTLAFGEAGIQEAMKNGGISKVHHVDQKLIYVLGGLYRQKTVMVYGE